jgi:hypothetical protein
MLAIPASKVLKYRLNQERTGVLFREEKFYGDIDSLRKCEGFYVKVEEMGFQTV